MKRVAYFSPLSPLRTGIASYSEALLPQLAPHVSLDLFVNGYMPSDNTLRAQFDIFDYHEFERMRRVRGYDAIVYQMGNSPFHGYIYETLLRHPGITVLHELVLHHFFVERTLEYGDTAGYVRELAYNAGQAGAVVAREAMRGRQPYPHYALPLYHRVVDASARVIVHSSYMARHIRASRPTARVSRVPLLCDPHALRSDAALTDALRARWQIPRGAFVVASFGRLDAPKRLDVLLGAVERLRARVSNPVVSGTNGVCCLLVGEAVPRYDIMAIVRSLDLEACVRLTGYVTQPEFFAAFDLADVAVNLRHPTGGETSAAVVQLLGRGVPTIVSDLGAFAELPDDACLKIPVGAREAEMLETTLIALASQPTMRDAMREAARAFVAREHTVERAAQLVAHQIEEQCVEGNRAR
ncbi:MAG: glycosyltransferase [Chloroflexota bacterium]